MRNNLKVASIFAALVVLWLASGLFSEPEAPVPNLLDAMASMSDLSLPSVVIEEIPVSYTHLTLPTTPYV